MKPPWTTPQAVGEMRSHEFKLLRATSVNCKAGLSKFSAECLLAGQALGPQQEWISELIFWTLFISFALWTFSPFVVERKRFYTVVLYGRLLMVLVGGLRPPAVSGLSCGILRDPLRFCMA